MLYFLPAGSGAALGSQYMKGIQYVYTCRVLLTIGNDQHFVWIKFALNFKI